MRDLEGPEGQKKRQNGGMNWDLTSTRVSSVLQVRIQMTAYFCTPLGSLNIYIRKQESTLSFIAKSQVCKSSVSES